MVVPFDLVGHVCYAAIAQFYCSGVEYFVTFVMWREILLGKVKEGSTTISLYTLNKWGVESDNSPFSCYI